MDYEISEKDIAPQLSLTRLETVTMDTIGKGLDAGFKALEERVAATGTQTAGPPFVFSPDFGQDQFDLHICMPVAAGAAGEGVGVEEIPGGHVVFTTHVGAYTEVPESELLVEVAIPLA